MNTTQVFESAVVKLSSGKFVDTYVTLKVSGNNVLVTVEYNGFVGTAFATREIGCYNDALDAMKQNNMLQQACSKLVEQVNACVTPFLIATMSEQSSL